LRRIQLLVALTMLVFAALSAQAQQCVRDNDCNVGRSFCGGEYRCMPGGAGADARGCIRPTAARCAANQSCDEANQRCVSGCSVTPDADRDGHRNLQCGGDDCDDQDANTFPGNNEVWDAADHDEDCNPETHGVPPQLQLVLTEHLQVCSGTGVVILSRIPELRYPGQTPYDHFQVATCSAGTVCIPQPSGEGVCGVKPPNYTDPPIIPNIPTGLQQHRHDAPAGLARPATEYKGIPSPRLGPPTRTPLCAKGQKWDPDTKTCK
jgi:hypothetical protein